MINLFIVWSCWVCYSQIEKAKCVIGYSHLRKNCGASVSFVVTDLKRNPALDVKLYASYKQTCTLTDTHTCTCQHSQKNGSNYVNIVTRRFYLGLKPTVQGPSFVQIREMKHHQVRLGENKPIKWWHLLISCHWAQGLIGTSLSRRRLWKPRFCC